MGGLCSKQASLNITTPNKPAAKPKTSDMDRIDRDKYYARCGLSVITATRQPPLLAMKPREPPKDKTFLRVKGIDLNVAENADAHVTFKYEITEDRVEGGHVIKPSLVIRRGQPFDITVKCDQAFNKAKDDLKLVFVLGKNPILSRGTLVPIVLSDEDLPNQWGAKIKAVRGHDVDITVFTPPNCMVGKWLIQVNYILPEGTGRQEYVCSHPDPIYMLFNPWCKSDQVYLDDESLRLEYCLNDYGKIYAGTSKQIGAKPWNFGQFEDFVLECVFHLLEKSGLPPRCRGDPVQVVRKLTAMCNSADDSGVLSGRWDGDYKDGKSPCSWIGSVRILEQYWRTKKAVKFGQCWVFSGVLTTICRAIGIPARSVTNFSSAHDTDASACIEMYWDKDGRPRGGGDSIWNFHVWNDVWMARPDLPYGYGGWQAIDSTPQETSNGIYVTGPCSVNAVRDGKVDLGHDALFVFAEVNADRINFLEQEDGSWKTMLQRNAVGKRISTKLPDGYNRRVMVSDRIPGDDPERQDITAAYKYAEGSSAERDAVHRACRFATGEPLAEDNKEDVTFNFIDKDAIMVGSDFTVDLRLENTSSDVRNVKIVLTCTVVKYTGVPVCIIKSETTDFTLNSFEGDQVKMQVLTADYVDKLVEQAAMKISVVAKVKETGQIFVDQDDFRLRRPDIFLDVKGNPEARKPFEVVVSFTNPLKKKLTKCEFGIEAPSLQKPMERKVKDVPPGGLAEVAFTITPRRRGRKMLIASFDCHELPDISGHTIVDVMESYD